MIITILIQLFVVLAIAALGFQVLRLLELWWPKRRPQPSAGGVRLEPGESVTLALDIPLDGSGSTCCTPVSGPAAPLDVLERMAHVNPDDFRRTGDILRTCAKMMDKAAKADPAERMKLLRRTRNLTGHWFDVIGLDAAQQKEEVDA